MIPKTVLCRLAFTGALMLALTSPRALAAPPEIAPVRSAAQLRATHAQAAAALAASPFGRPLTIESRESRGSLSGKVLVEIDQPLARVAATLKDPAAWCEVMLLTPNIVACRAGGSVDSQSLAVRLSRRFDQPVKDAYAATFSFHVQADTPDYAYLVLAADKGPVGTRDYRFDVEALSLDASRTVLRMVYAYSYGLTARLATQAYLSTKGSDKIGFSTETDKKSGERHPVGGLRGSVERNAMRYYLAIEARAAQASGGDAGSRFDRSLDQWIAAIGRYQKQLGEDDVEAYRKAKRAQFAARNEAEAGGA